MYKYWITKNTELTGSEGVKTHTYKGAQDITLWNIKSPIFQELSALYGQITQSGVQVDINAPKGQDLAQIMEEMRANYEKIVLKNQEELKAWHESKVGHNFSMQSYLCFKEKKLSVIHILFWIDIRGAGSSDREHCSTERSQQATQREPQADANFWNWAAIYDWKCKRVWNTSMKLPNFKYIT